MNLALRVPVADKGAPQWRKAEIDRGEPGTREAAEMLEELRGGRGWRCEGLRSAPSATFFRRGGGRVGRDDEGHRKARH